MSRGVPFAPGNKFGRGRPKGSRNKGGQHWPASFPSVPSP
jgi:hypothetical protein